MEHCAEGNSVRHSRLGLLPFELCFAIYRHNPCGMIIFYGFFFNAVLAKMYTAQKTYKNNKPNEKSVDC